MATAITQARRTLSLQTPLGEDVLLMNSFSGAEEISRLFNFSLDLLAERGQKINFDDIVGKAVTITLLLPDDEKRYFNGVLGRISQGHRDTRFDHYRAEVYPWFWLLPTVVLATESVLSIRRLSWLDKLFVLLLLPEELYQLFRQAYLVRAAWLSVRRRAWAW